MSFTLRAVGVVAVLAASAARADVISIAAEQAGNYASDGIGNINTLAFQNYFVGYSTPSAIAERRNFFHFHTGPLGSVTVVSGELVVYVPKFAPGATTDPGDGYISPDPSEVYRISGTMVPASEVTDATNSPAESMAIWDTLGTGLFFGAIEVFPSSKGTYLHIPLSAAAIGILDTGPTDFVIGGKLDSLDRSRPMVLDELLFSFTDVPGSGVFEPPTLKLTIVPGPGSLVLVLAGAAGVMAARRRASVFRA
ncbi:MAG: hypothetical protein JNM07_10980 [Phycisphaerae bacterium]|nr:hypothetical protein [Phycisphaerae bacterium]